MSTKEENKKDDMKVAIEEIKGDIKLLMDKIEGLIRSVGDLSNKAVTRPELELTINPMEIRIKSLEDFRTNIIKTIVGVAGVLLFGLFTYTVANSIPGLNL